MEQRKYRKKNPRQNNLEYVSIAGLSNIQYFPYVNIHQRLVPLLNNTQK